MNEMEQLRLKIAQIDEQIIDLIGLRHSIAQQIGTFKKQNKLPIYDHARESLLHEFHINACSKYGVSQELINKIFTVLMDEARKVQQDEY
jgi:chorismate mutase